MWGRCALALTLVAAVGCGSGTSGQPRTDASTSASPTSSASGSPPALADAGRATIAVTRDSGALELFTIDKGARTARKLRTLAGPSATAKTQWVTLSGGATPTVCAIWADGDKTSTTCYAGDDTQGVAVSSARMKHPRHIEVSYSGRSIGWVEAASERNASFPDVCGGSFDGHQVTEPVCIPAREPGEKRDEYDPALFVSGLAWVGEHTLLISHSVDDDVNASIAIARIDVKDPPPWDREGQGTYVKTTDDWPLISGAASSSAASAVLVVQGGFSGATGAQTGRAVRIDVTSGAIVEVIATALPGRQVLSVSGGERGVLYRTGDYDRAVKTYWRMPGEKHGLPLVGLPLDARVVLAQP